MNPDISVIVPVYNREKYLAECVDSILSQTFKNFELILVDDGSYDSSPRMCDEYAERDSRVKIIHKENGGVSSARNAGICASNGKYLTFIDSDDRVDDEFLEYSYKHVIDNDLDLFITGIVMEFWENGSVVNKVDSSVSEDRMLDGKGLLEAWEREYPVVLTSGPWCKLYRTQLIKEYGVWFDETLNCGEDTCFNLDVIKNIKTAYLSDKIFYHYRRDDKDSLFTRFHKDAYEIYYKVLGKMRQTMLDCGCSDDTLVNFEIYYFKAMNSAVQEYYTFYNDSTKEEKLQLIRKVSGDKYVRKMKIRYIKRMRTMLFLLLVKLNQSRIIAFIYDVYYNLKMKKEN